MSKHPRRFDLLGGPVFTKLLDLFGVSSLCVFAFFVWSPLPLLVLGLACLAASRKATR